MIFYIQLSMNLAGAKCYFQRRIEYSGYNLQTPNITELLSKLVSFKKWSFSAAKIMAVGSFLTKTRILSSADIKRSAKLLEKIPWLLGTYIKEESKLKAYVETVRNRMKDHNFNDWRKRNVTLWKQHIFQKELNLQNNMWNDPSKNR